MLIIRRERRVMVAAAVAAVGVLLSPSVAAARQIVVLALSGSCLGDLTVAFAGATPGASVEVYRSRLAGSDAVPSGLCAGTLLGLAGPKLVTTVPADENGGFSIAGALMGAVCGHFFQTVDLTTCITSNVERLVSGYPAPVPKTGQTFAYQTGDDGWWEKGVDWPRPRFTDNRDGTVRDRLTGLIWLQDASCFGQSMYAEALEQAEDLSDGQCGLADGSKVGDWRLPNIRELQSLLDWSEFRPALPAGHPFSGVEEYLYWSSTADTALPELYAWTVNLRNGHVSSQWKLDGTNFTWAVRGGE